MTRFLRLILFTVALTGCDATPVPEPPNLDPESMTAVRLPPEGCPAVEIGGGPGAAPPGSVVWGVDLFCLFSCAPGEPLRPGEPNETVVNDDGSFLLDVQTDHGCEVRLQIRGGERREPVDAFVVRAPDATTALVRAPREPCLVLDPPFELDLGQVAAGADTSRSIVLRNECVDPVRVDSIALRAPSAELTVVASAPIAIDPGGESRLDVRFAPAATGPIESLLLVSIGAPFIETRAIGLFGEGRP